LHEDDALARLQEPVQPFHLVGVHPHALERHGARGAVEDADHDLLAVRGGQRRDAQVHGLAVHHDAGAAVLRAQPVGDVEPGDDLHARDERHAGGARQLEHLPQHAVHAVAHAEPALVRLEVDVARAGGDPLGDDIVDELDDRPVGARLREVARVPVVGVGGDGLHVVLVGDRLENAADDAARRRLLRVQRLEALDDRYR
jgi:hypothetical protein